MRGSPCRVSKAPHDKASKYGDEKTFSIFLAHRDLKPSLCKKFSLDLVDLPTLSPILCNKIIRRRELPSEVLKDSRSSEL